MFILDRDKGLRAADNKLRNRVIKTIYTYYLINNFIT
jgi:hypothetical protein